MLLIELEQFETTQNFKTRGNSAGVKLTDRGQVEVNGHLQTSASNIYAIGDVIKGAMLAHKAEEEGVFVAETIAGDNLTIEVDLIQAIAMHVGLRFAIREGGRTVGAGQVTEILD